MNTIDKVLIKFNNGLESDWLRRFIWVEVFLCSSHSDPRLYISKIYLEI
jgi:hypothetical protein